MPPPAPVKVVFGRPNIGKYLAETFATVSASNPRRPDGERSGRRDASRQRDDLDSSQKKSKAALMKADSKHHFKNNRKSQVSSPTFILYIFPFYIVLRSFDFCCCVSLNRRPRREDCSTVSSGLGSFRLPFR